MSPFDHVPNEIIRGILLFVSPDRNLLSIQLVSHRFREIANEPLLWRYHCRNTFKFWSPEHDFEKKLEGKPSGEGWKELFVERKKRNHRISTLLDGILASAVGRARKFEQICRLGYDAKDFLLEQCHTADSAEDGLSRRYYGDAVLGSIHRSIAIEQWSKIQRTQPRRSSSVLEYREPNVKLEHALGAFDMFVLHDQPGDLNDITEELDALAARFRLTHPGFEGPSTRFKALMLLRWVRSENLVGMKDPKVNYRHLRNCMIGHALLEPNHESLPIISSAIYCIIAQRLGLDAHLCAFPGHVLSVVFPPPGQSLDGGPNNNGSLEKLFLDAFASEDEVRREDLQERLALFGWEDRVDLFTQASPLSAIIHRTAENVKASFHVAQSIEDMTGLEMSNLRGGDPKMNKEAAFYAYRWANKLMMASWGDEWMRGLDEFLASFAEKWSEDAWIVQKYIAPLYDDSTRRHMPAQPRRGFDNVHETLQFLRAADEKVPELMPRNTPEIHASVLYKVGQVFAHKRFAHVGIITGWASPGSDPAIFNSAEEAMEEFLAKSRGIPPRRLRRTPDTLRRSDTFYSCLSSHLNRGIVAQDNVEIITEPEVIPQRLFLVAGRYFKSFDPTTCRFISNMREIYPDD